MISHYLLLVCCLITVSEIAESEKSTFKFENCNTGKSIAEITRFTLSPDPISLSKNIKATVDIHLFDDIPPGTIIQTKIYKVTRFFGLHIKVPCIGGSGSCTTDFCNYLSKMKNQLCPFFPTGVKCGCPLKAGNYGGENITISMPPLGPLIKFLASGKFKTEIQFIAKEESVEKILFCYTFSGTSVS